MSDLDKVIADTWIFGHSNPDFESCKDNIFVNRIKYHLAENGYTIIKTGDIVPVNETYICPASKKMIVGLRGCTAKDLSIVMTWDKTGEVCYLDITKKESNDVAAY